MSDIEIVGGDYDFLGDDGDELDALLGDDVEILGDDDDDDGEAGDFFGAAMSPARRRMRIRPGGGGNLVLARANQIVQLARKKQAQKLALSKLERTAAVLRSKSYREIRKTLAGFGGTAAADVATGDSVNITWRAVAPMRPNRLFIPSTIAPFLSLTKLTVGMDNYLPTPDGIPCECFVQDTTAGDDDGTGFFKLPTLQVGLDLNMTFENVGNSTIRVRGAWLCSAAV